MHSTNAERHISGTISMLDTVNLSSKYVSPRAEISLDSSDFKIIVEERRRSKARFTDSRNGDELFRSSPPSRSEYGFFRWMKHIHFYERDHRIAEITYRHWLSSPAFVIGGREAPISVQEAAEELVYKSEEFEIRLHKSSDSHFTVLNREHLYPCLGFLYYLWSSTWN